MGKIFWKANRPQAIALGGYRSDFINICSGVPQGSHLGPLFYIAYIYNIYTAILYVTDITRCLCAAAAVSSISKQRVKSLNR